MASIFRHKRKGAGRRDTGIRSGYVRIEAYVPPDIRKAVGELSAQQTQRTGEHTTRSDIVRAALQAYVDAQLTEMGSTEQA